MTVNKSVERSHAQQETATNCGDIGLQAVLSTVRLLPNIFLHRKTYYVSYYVSSISSRSSSAFPGAFCTENKTKEGTFSTQQVLRVIITCDCHMFMLFVRIYMKTVGSSAVDTHRVFTPKSLNELFLRIFQNPCGTFALSVSCHTNRHLPVFRQYHRFAKCNSSDIAAIGKARAACAQSFALWQQATIDTTRRNHSSIVCSRHAYMLLFFARKPFVVNHTHNTTPPERLQQHLILFTTNRTDRTFFV